MKPFHEMHRKGHSASLQNPRISGPTAFLTWSFAGPIWVFSGSNRQQSYWKLSLLVHLRQDFVPFTGALKQHRSFGEII